MVTSLEKPSPTFSSAIAASSLLVNSPATPLCTYMRLVQTQVCPQFRNLVAMQSITAASISASSNTINGALPPSSRDTFLTPSAHCFIRVLPTGVEPVNVNLPILGCWVSTVPISRELLPTTTLITPFGIPARSASSHIASADSGVSVAGLITMVQPDPRAGPALRAIIAFGKFQGVIQPTTPTGCL